MGPTETYIMPFSSCSYSHFFHSQYEGGFNREIQNAILLLLYTHSFPSQNKLRPNWDIHNVILLLILFSFLSFSVLRYTYWYCHPPIALILITLVFYNGWCPTEAYLLPFSNCCYSHSSRSKFCMYWRPSEIYICCNSLFLSEYVCTSI